MQFEIIIMITANGRVSPGLQTSAFGCGSAIGVRGTTCGFKVLEVQPKSEAVLKKKTISKRELIAPRGDKRYIRRDEGGRIKENDDVSHSLSQYRRRMAKTVAKPGQGDRGDRKPASPKKSDTHAKR